jgi:hypothetical protein
VVARVRRRLRPLRTKATLAVHEEGPEVPRAAADGGKIGHPRAPASVGGLDEVGDRDAAVEDHFAFGAVGGGEAVGAVELDRCVHRVTPCANGNDDAIDARERIGGVTLANLVARRGYC